ncbi:MAG: hypothetical protein CUR32_10605 [Flavobacterium sp.]|nr:MAG: hypothetical protein CUR32_10605 [Flavobacterium sp.] [Flavobacterium sp. FEMGT703F]
MKKLYFLLFFITISLYGQPPINQPSQLVACQVSNAQGLFNLTSKNAEILGSLDPTLFTVNYYESYPDSQNGINSIQNPTQYIFSGNGFQTVFVRVFENQNPSNFALTYLQLQLYYLPYILQSPNMTVYELPNDGVAAFNLNIQIPLMLSSQQNMLVTFHTSEADAHNNSNPLLNTTSYTNVSNPQTIFARVENSISGCYSIANFQLIVASDGIVNIPDANLKAKLLSANENNSIASNVNPNNSATLNTYTKIDANQDGQIQFSEAQAIIYLNVSGTQSTNVGIQNLQGIEAFYNLITFSCKYNQLSSIDLSVLPKIRNFYCTNNNLTSLNLANTSDLRIIDCGYNQLTNLNLHDSVNLTSLSARNNQLTSLDLSNNDKIEYVYIVSNSLTSFELSNKNFVRTLELGLNQLTSIQLFNLPILYRIKVQNNNLTNIDLSSVAFQVEPNNVPSANVFDVYLNNNVNLRVVNIRNGFTNEDVSFASGSLNDLQQYICVDENDVFSFFSPTPNPIFGTYCSFTPNGYYNIITGTILFDAEQNGCNADDMSNPNIRIDINDGINQGSTFTDNSGIYNFYTEAGSFELNLNVENPSWFNLSPNNASVSFADDNNNTATQNFCITANGIHPDLEIIVAPVFPSRPGFEAVYKIVYRNKGNQTLSQAYGINFFYNDNLMDMVSTSIVPTSVVSGGLSWDYANLQPFESREILVTFNINTPTAANPVNINDVLTFTASILPQAGDENTSDNLYVYNEVVVGSYDPNDIKCLEGDVVSPAEIGDYLHYMIRFENTGTAEAENIVVRTEVNPADFDINSLQLLNTSHPVNAKITGNVVEFIFQNILLESGGHGNVLLKVKSKDTLQQGDNVNKRANIYFDYNYPVATNEAETIFQALSNPDFEQDQSISVYPNPTKDKVNVSGDFTLQTVQLYDVQGRLLQTQLANDNQTIIDISAHSNGVYFIKVTSDKGIKVGKIVKE